MFIDWGQLEERVDQEARVRDSHSPKNNLFSSLIFFFNLALDYNSTRASMQMLGQCNMAVAEPVAG